VLYLLISRCLRLTISRLTSWFTLSVVYLNPKHSWLCTQYRLADPSTVSRLAGSVVSGHLNRTIIYSHPFYIKIYRRMPLYQRLFGLALTAVYREWQHLKHAQSLRLFPPEWVAVGVDSLGRPFLITLAISQPVPINQYLLTNSPGFCDGLATRLGRIIGRMIQTRFIHCDLTAKHILVDPYTHRISMLDWQRVSSRASVPLLIAKLLASLMIKTHSRTLVHIAFRELCFVCGYTRSQRKQLFKDILQAYRKYRQQPALLEQHPTPHRLDQRLIQHEQGTQSVRATHAPFVVPISTVDDLPNLTVSLGRNKGYMILARSVGYRLFNPHGYLQIAGRCFRLERCGIPTRFIIHFGVVGSRLLGRWFAVSFDPPGLQSVKIFTPDLCALITKLSRFGYQPLSIDNFRFDPATSRLIVYEVERLCRSS
jgi:hypothetical protein